VAAWRFNAAEKFVVDNAVRRGLTSHSDTLSSHMSGPARSENTDEWAPDSTSRPRRPSRWLAGALIFLAACVEMARHKRPSEAKKVAVKSSEAVIVVTLCLLAASVPSGGQQPGKVYRIGGVSVSTGGYDTDAQNCPITGDANIVGGPISGVRPLLPNQRSLGRVKNRCCLPVPPSPDQGRSTQAFDE